MTIARVGIIGDFSAGYLSHRETNAALSGAGERLGIELSHEWVATDAVAEQGTNILRTFDGFWAAPGSPYRSLDGVLSGIRYARESGRPFFGT
jgi:CTP synthase (UTP-ammonia lyase)